MQSMQVTMSKFAEFCVGSPADRARIIDRREYDRQRRKDGKKGGGGGYSVLLKVLREHHWETNDIEQLDAAVIDIDPNTSGYLKILKTYRCLKDKYVSKWRTQAADYFGEIKRADVSFGELSVTVDPEVGMWTSTEHRVFKLWFLEQEISEQILAVCSYLLWEGAAYAPWPRHWRPGMWDVRNSRLMAARSPADGMDEWIHECAAEFVALSRP